MPSTVNEMLQQMDDVPDQQEALLHEVRQRISHDGDASFEHAYATAVGQRALQGLQTSTEQTLSAVGTMLQQRLVGTVSIAQFHNVLTTLRDEAGPVLMHGDATLSLVRALLTDLPDQRFVIPVLKAFVSQDVSIDEIEAFLLQETFNQRSLLPTTPTGLSWVRFKR